MHFEWRSNLTFEWLDIKHGNFLCLFFFAFIFWVCVRLFIFVFLLFVFCFGLFFSFFLFFVFFFSFRSAFSPLFLLAGFCNREMRNCSSLTRNYHETHSGFEVRRMWRRWWILIGKLSRNSGSFIFRLIRFAFYRFSLKLFIFSFILGPPLTSYRLLTVQWKEMKWSGRNSGKRNSQSDRSCWLAYCQWRHRSCPPGISNVIAIPESHTSNSAIRFCGYQPMWRQICNELLERGYVVNVSCKLLLRGAVGLLFETAQQVLR